MKASQWKSCVAGAHVRSETQNFKESSFTGMMPAPLSCTSSQWINHQAPGNHNVTTMWGAFFPETMEFCPIVFGRHLQLQDIALFYWKYSALASWDMAGRAVELDWAITDVPVGHWDILSGAGRGGGSHFERWRRHKCISQSWVWVSWPITLCPDHKSLAGVFPAYRSQDWEKHNCRSWGSLS